MKTKATSKIMMAALALVMALALATGTTFAWFSMNNTVSVTGMTVSTKVSNNLLIAEDTTASTSNVAETAFKTSYVAGTAIDALLEPVSTTNGTSFFYTSSTNVGGTGSAIASSYIAYNEAAVPSSAELTAFNTNAGSTGAVGFVDYAFQLKANNTDPDEDAYINVTALNLVYGDTQDPVEKAFRVAIFVEELGDSDDLNAPIGTLGTPVTVLRPSGAHYFSYAVDTTESAVSSISGKSDISSLLDTAANLATVAGGATSYYKVVVRLWLEGEDTTCKNDTFALLTDNWALDITIQLQDATGGVTALGTSDGAKINLASDSASATTVVVDGTPYYRLTTNTSYYTLDSTLTSTSRVFTITNNHPIEVTHKCTLPA